MAGFRSHAEHAPCCPKCGLSPRGAPSPATCDGITTPCTYDKIGEVNVNLSVNLSGVLATQAGITTPFAVHADSAPTIYVAGQPGPSDPNVRRLERTLAALTVTNPYTGQTEPLANYLADPVEMKLLHMVTADPARIPTLTLFAKPDYFLVTAGPNCAKPCVAIESDFAWNHGTVAPEVNQTWAAFAGPGVSRRGVDADTWTDQTDLRPTAMALLGLKDAYGHDGWVIVEIMADSALSPALQASRDNFIRLATLYKQLNAPVGAFGLTSLDISTKALASDTPQDSAFVAWESALANLGGTRDAVAAQMAQGLDGAAFSGQPLRGRDVAALLAAGQALLARVHALASNPPASPASAASPTAVPAGTPVATPHATPTA